MQRLPQPLRNYIHLMQMAKRRLMFIDGYNDKNIGFLDIEIIAIQLRKIIEAVSYGCVCACELGGNQLTKRTFELYDAREVFLELKRQQLDFVPQACVFHFSGQDEITDWRIEKKDTSKSKQFSSAKDFQKAYEKLHQYAHEFHPRRPHHLLNKDGLHRATSILRPIKTKLSNTLWQHFLPFGNRTLIVDFGDHNDAPPETFVFSRTDRHASWPILYAVAQSTD